jgi:hypothetical protein
MNFRISSPADSSKKIKNHSPIVCFTVQSFVGSQVYLREVGSAMALALEAEEEEELALVAAAGSAL